MSSAMNRKKFSTNSGLPLNLARSSGFWVATPTGQVSRWQTRIMTQPDTTGEADLPRHASMFEAGQRCGAGAAVVARDEDDVGVRLGHAGRDGPDTDRADELDVDAGVLVGVLQVVDKLGEVLDRIDVVVRRRRDQTDAGCRVPGLGDVRIHLEARKLTALTGFGTLSHLDLDVGGVDQVVAGDTEAAGGDLLDGAAPFRIVETVNILTALTAI